MDANKIVRQILHKIGACRVTHRQNDSWHAMWHKHPHNHASNGKYVLIGMTTGDAVAYLRNYNAWCWEQLKNIA